MKITFFIIVLFHGLIHLLGFIKGFGIKEVKELTLPISKPMALLWLLATVTTLIYGVLLITNNKYSWLFGMIAVIISQILIILFWKDAKFGTLPNIAILIVSIFAYGHYNFHQKVEEETKSVLSKSMVSSKNYVTENDIKDLPKPVKEWLHQSGIIGKPYIKIGRVTQLAKMKMKPEQQDWMNATALQYTTIDHPAFVWTVDVKMNSLINFQGRDKFEDGKGAMLIKLNSLFNIVDEQGVKLDEGSIQRYLGELVWFPSLALSPYITWKEINDTSAEATINYKGTKGSGTFYFNSTGDFIKFSALRYKGNESNAKRHEWVLLVHDYKTFEGIKVPSNITATWKLNQGDWTWLKLEIMDIAFNENVIR